MVSSLQLTVVPRCFAEWVPPRGSTKALSSRAHVGTVRALTGDIGGSRVEAQFPGLTTSAAMARSFLHVALQTWDLNRVGAVTELLADELVANVVEHVHTPMTVRAIRDRSSLRVEVDDPSTDPPRLL